MKENLINEELKRIRLLYSYKNENTLSENLKNLPIKKFLLNERNAVIKDLLTAEKGVLKAGIESAIKDIGDITIMDYKGIAFSTRAGEEIALAIKTGRISAPELGKVAKGLFKSGRLDLKVLAKETIVDTPSFFKKYNLKTQEQIVKELQEGGKYTKQEAEDLAKAFEKNQKLKKTKIPDPKPKPDPYNPTPAPYNPRPDRYYNRKTWRSNAEYERHLKSEFEDFSRTYGRETDEFARSKGWNNIDDWYRRDRAGFETTIKEGRNGKGFFARIFKRFGVLSALGFIIKFGLLAIGAYMLYKAIFGTDDPCEDEPGTKFVQGKGCIPVIDPNPKPDVDEDPVVKDTTTVRGGGGESYIECEPPFYKGCINKKGDTDIKKVQDCLGVTPNGFFNQETEDALYKKINKKSFSPSDIDTICARSYGGSSFQI